MDFLDGGVELVSGLDHGQENAKRCCFGRKGTDMLCSKISLLDFPTWS